MGEDLKPCLCGADINEYFTIELLYANHRWDVYKCGCWSCGELAVFRSDRCGDDDKYQLANHAWNTRAQDKDHTSNGEEYFR